MKRYLFFLRSHNDTDNIAPALWFLLEDDSSAIVDIAYYHFDFPYLSHPYIRALKARFGDRLKILWIGNFLGLDYADLFEHKRIPSAQAVRLREFFKLDRSSFDRVFKTRRPLEWRAIALARHIWGPTTLSISNLTAAASHISARSLDIPQTVRQQFVAWLIGKEPTPCLAVFDHQRGPSLQGLFDALRSAGVEKIVRLPVSPMVNINILRRARYVVPTRERLQSELDFTGFDAVAYTDRYYPENLRRFFVDMGWGDPLKGKLAVVGAIRYCPEWLALRPQPSVFSSPDTDDRIKLAFFLSRAETNAYWDEVKRTIQVLGSFLHFRVVIQPHPRDVSTLENGDRRIEINTQVSAPSLIEWADVVMLWGSSVGLEALIKGKTMLYLGYVNANLSLYEKFRAGWVLRCRDDLALALRKLERDRRTREYQQADVDRLIQEVVLAGDSKPVPTRYLDFLRANEKT